MGWTEPPGQKMAVGQRVGKSSVPALVLSTSVKVDVTLSEARLSKYLLFIPSSKSERTAIAEG